MTRRHFVTAAFCLTILARAQADTITVCWDGSGDCVFIQEGIWMISRRAFGSHDHPWMDQLPSSPSRTS